MADVVHAAPRVVTVAEMNGRIAELEAQRNEALGRCSILAGEKALAHDILRQARAEIDRLNALVLDVPLDAEVPN